LLDRSYHRLFETAHVVICWFGGMRSPKTATVLPHGDFS